MIENSSTKRNLVTDERGRTRIWVLLLSSILVVWSIAIYAYIVMAVPSFRELFAGFGADLPSLTAFVIKYSWLCVVLAPLSIIPLVALWRKRSSENIDKGRDFKRVIIAFMISVVIGNVSVYGLYLPIFKMGAAVS
jgi:type II secretory pathway component PulF